MTLEEFYALHGISTTQYPLTTHALAMITKDTQEAFA